MTRNGQKKARVTKANNAKLTQAKKANHVELLNEPRALSNLPRRQALEGKLTPPSNADKRISSVSRRSISGETYPLLVFVKLSSRN